MIEYNQEQRAAIDSGRNTTIVPAGPGSGKSRTLVGRVIMLVRNGVDPRSIVILTFTNGGADVFSQRLLAQGITRVGYMGTLHGYGMKIIQMYGSILGYRANTVSIVTEEAKMILLEEINETLGKKLTKKALLAPPETPDQRLIWDEYRHRIKRANMVDYDGILVDCLELLKRESVKLALEIEELLVDERQDSGAIDTNVYWEIPAKSRFFVGDIDQCVYAFRGAAPELFLDEANKYGSIPLELNYRSDFQICNAANALIAHNQVRADKKIVPVSTLPGVIAVNEYDHAADEIYGAWSDIKEMMGESSTFGGSYDDIAILARTNTIADMARETLRGLGLPIKGGQRTRLPADWNFAITCVSMMVDPANDFHAEAFLRARGESNEKIKGWKLRALQESQSLASIALLPNMAPASIVDALQNLVLLGVSDESMSLIRARFASFPGDNHAITLSDLLTDIFRSDKWENQDVSVGVTVSTIHAAKGKEWSMVFVIGMEEGIFPHGSKRLMETATGNCAILANELEEERRLCFVAVTRAKNILILSHAKQRTMFFKTHDQTRSRFIAEMGL